MKKAEERAKLLAEMKDMNAKAEAEKRSFTDEEKTLFAQKEEQVRALDAEIEAEARKNALAGFSSKAPAPAVDPAENDEARAKAFASSGKMQVRALLSTGSIVKPSKNGTDIAGLAEIGDSIVDDVHAIPLSGAGAWVAAYKNKDASAASVTEGAEIGGTGAAFNYVTISPDTWGILDEISNQVKKMSPLAYENAVKNSALIALRSYAADVIIKKIAASSLTDAKTYALDATYIRNLVINYRSIAGKGGVKLYIAQADLATLGAVRGTNEKKPVYDIEFDAGTTTSGTIKDGGTAVQFRVIDALAAGTQYFGQPGAIDMPMWDSYQINTDEGGDYFKRNVMGIRGIQTANADLVAKGAIQVVTQSAKSE